MEINYYTPDLPSNVFVKYVIIISRYRQKWITVKHKLRDTWEIPGGHTEKGESPEQSAKRELYEETGAIEYELKKICGYSVTIDNNTSYGYLFFAEIGKLISLPDSEIETVQWTETLPDNLTYPDLQPHFFNKVRELCNI